VSAAVVDLNGDGKLDAAVGNDGYWNDVRVMLGDGAGGFREHGSPLEVGPYPRWLTSADSAARSPRAASRSGSLTRTSIATARKTSSFRFSGTAIGSGSSLATVREALPRRRS
jgi:hypothetical protein